MKGGVIVAEINFNYYHGKESEQFSFFRIPKVLYTDPIFKNLSSDAKVLYGILLDRMELSMKNGWVDENNKVYIYFTIEILWKSWDGGEQEISKGAFRTRYRKGGDWPYRKAKARSGGEAH